MNEKVSEERLKELGQHYEDATDASIAGTRARDLVLAIGELLAARKTIARLDPDPVVCGCREAGCPHTAIAQLPRQALVDHYKERIKSLEQQLARPSGEPTGEAVYVLMLKARLATYDTYGGPVEFSGHDMEALRKVIAALRLLAGDL